MVELAAAKVDGDWARGSTKSPVILAWGQGAANAWGDIGKFGRTIDAVEQALIQTALNQNLLPGDSGRIGQKGKRICRRLELRCRVTLLTARINASFSFKKFSPQFL